MACPSMPWGQKINVASILFSCTFVLPQQTHGKSKKLTAKAKTHGKTKNTRGKSKKLTAKAESSLQNQNQRKVWVLTIWRKNPEISVWSQMVRKFSRNSVRKLWNSFRGTPLFPFGTERRKFPYHLLNFPVSSLSSAKNNYGKSMCKW